VPRGGPRVRAAHDERCERARTGNVGDEQLAALDFTVHLNDAKSLALCEALAVTVGAKIYYHDALSICMELAHDAFHSAVLSEEWVFEAWRWHLRVEELVLEREEWVMELEPLLPY
jgi:hypothetical protein